MSEQQMNDSTFSRLFIIMILAMSVLAVILMVLSVYAASEVNARLDERSEQENSSAIAERLAPVGQFSASTVASVAPIAKTPMTGDQVYASCAACHDSGTLDAPILGNADHWTARIAQGIDTLYANAINGINNMPAKGGNVSLSDEEVKAAVDYMLEKSK
jgi:cytochrome c5